MYKDYNILVKEITRFEKKYGKIELLIIPKDESTIVDVETALQTNIENYYIALFRHMNRYEYGVYMDKVGNSDFIGLAEFICDSLWVKGDEIIKKDDDLFSSIYNNELFLTKFGEHIINKVKPYKVDEENYTIYIRKEGTEQFELEDVNETDFHKLVFRKATRNDLRNYYIQQASIPAQESVLHNLCIEGRELISDDDIFFTIILGKQGQVNIADLIMSKKMSYLKKN